MISRIIAAAGTLALAACAAPGARDRYDRLLTPTANPSQVVATELAFARAAQEDGQWTAFRDYSTGDAIMFVPEPVNAHEWLRRQTDPARAVTWQPHQVWSSCDGSLAVTRGAAQWPGGEHGDFVTVWQRQTNGEYEWIMDQGDTRETPLPAPEMIGTVVASCTGEPDDITIIDFVEGTPVGGTSRDGTLQWSVTVRPDKSRRVRISYWDGQDWQSPVNLDAGR